MAIYFPLLRWKQGERGALENLFPETKDKICPIIEFPANLEYSDRKVADFCNNAISDWGINRPFYIDLTTINYSGIPDGATHPALTLLRNARLQGLLAIPVLTLDMDLNLMSAIQQAYTEECFWNLAFRVIEDSENDAQNDIFQIIDDFGIEITSVDLLIDLCDVSTGSLRTRIRGLSGLIGEFSSNYRRTIVLSGAIPNDIGIDTDNSGRIPRNDWRLWIQARQNESLKHILFGDYTTISCEFREVQYQGAPKIKYTLNDEWYIIKGHKPRGRDNQRTEHARTLITSGFFRGAQNSFGELRIQQCANGTWGPGNATNWVSNDVNQHITFVVSQVSAILAAP